MRDIKYSENTIRLSFIIIKKDFFFLLRKKALLLLCINSVFLSFPNVTTAIKEDDMNRACSMHGGDKKFIHNFGQNT
jgi:hypothetical protein